MGIRLNKVLTELNIGLQTAVDFLKNKSSLGEIREDATSNTKISDQQYEALVEAFSSDKAVKTQADKLFPKKPKEKKQEAGPVKTKTEEEMKQRQQFKPLGKIDLSSLNKPKPAAATTVKEEAPVAPAVSQKPKDTESAPPAATSPQEEKESAKATPKAEAPKPAKPVASAEQPKTDAEPAETKVASKQEEKTKEDAPTAAEAPKQAHVKTEAKKEEPSPSDKEAESTQQPVNEEKPTDTAPVKTVFTLKSEEKLAPKVNVLGKIDLSTINQSTRPKKKSKEEKRKQREEKAAQQRTGTGQNGEKKKRERIRTGKVDIEEAAKQQQQQGGGKKKNKGGNQNFSEQQQGGGKNNKKKPQQPVKLVEVSDEDVARQVKETLARLTSKTTINKKGAKYRKEKRDAVAERLSEEMAAEAAQSKVLKLTEFVTVSELATMMNVPVVKVISTCMAIGIMASINQRLEAETINLVAEEFGFTTEYVSAEVQNAIHEEEDDENDLLPRAPIVTVMGHVDHGKTSLLDYIRKTNVIAGEAGGITQHIGAYSVELPDGREITFLDTPGHEAFTAMRARGAQVTDIAIIIVAADDSVMPTTKEAIAHAQAANVPMVFAINKIDKPGANPDKIREDLANMNLLVEEWGGKYQCQEISAKKGIGVEELLEKVLLEAEMLDLKANPNRKATGSIIESSLDKGRGYVATVLVESGTLHQGDIVLAGSFVGSVKAMFNERGTKITEAGPSTPALILGLDGAPQAGDTFNVMDDFHEAREIAVKRAQLQREQGIRTTKHITLDEIGRRIAIGNFQELNIIVKGDVDGSIEAITDSLIKLSTPEIQVNVIHKAVGQISESDILLAAASNAIIVGFQVRPSLNARKLAEKEQIDIRLYSIIYDAIEEIKAAMEGMLSPEIKEEIVATLDIREVFKITKVGTVAGCIVREGKITRNTKVRVIRDGIVIHTGELGSLRRFKDDVKEVTSGYECGLNLVSYNDLQPGDTIEGFQETEVKKKL